MTNKEYREHVGISKSNLFHIAKSPLHFQYAQEHPTEDTAALIFGRASHKFILEESDFYNEFAIAPNVDKRTKLGKSDWETFVLNSGDKDVISQDDFEKIQAMAKVIHDNPEAERLIQGQHEQSFFWTDTITGEPCKCRPDILTELDGMKYIVDYKTCDSCQDNHFERNCRKYGYDLQAGMYTEGMFNNTFEKYGFKFLAQEKTAPYAVRIYNCTPDYINQGYDKFRELIGIYHDCKTTGNWYGYETALSVETDLYADEI